MLRLLFPNKCIVCRSLLKKDETDLCHNCRKNIPEFSKAKRNIPFVARWTAMWYYKDDVRRSIHRFKFYNARHYAVSYGRLLAMRLQQAYPDGFDAVTWVPTTPIRKFFRGYDQAQLLAVAVAKELGLPCAHLLRKIRNTPPQSGISDAAARRANVLGSYTIANRQATVGQRILLIDDVITTGSTVSECARVLMTAGAKEVYCAAVAAASNDKKSGVCR